MSTVANQDSLNSARSTGPAPAPAVEARRRHPDTASSAAAAEPQTTPGVTAVALPQPPVAAASVHRQRRWLLLAAAAAAVVVGGYFLVPWAVVAMTTVSTDDAYVNGHMTYVAPRVSGEVAKVLVEDNKRVKKGDILVQLDKEPFQVQVSLKRSAVEVAEANVAAAESHARSLEALAGSQRWRIQTASQQVKNQIAVLKSRIAMLRTREATLDRARSDFERARRLVPSGAMTREEFDLRQQDIRVAEASVSQAREDVFQVRATLGLPPEPENGKDLSDVPPDLEETFSDVRAALSDLVQSMVQLGVPLAPIQATPRQAIAEFQRLFGEADLDRILRNLLPKVPAVLQAKAQLDQARHDLELAELNLRYCDVVSEIDGVVTAKNVNPGNNVQTGQSLMGIRSVAEIWIDANFKETELADLRIGQRVRIEVDMYGRRKEFAGRITGFTMGTGQTLALLPPQNATGNFVKIVQRLPVRIELTDYDPAHAPLFVGLSVTPYVYYKEPPTGPHAGEILQPLAELPAKVAHQVER